MQSDDTAQKAIQTTSDRAVRGWADGKAGPRQGQGEKRLWATWRVRQLRELLKVGLSARQKEAGSRRSPCKWQKFCFGISFSAERVVDVNAGGFSPIAIVFVYSYICTRQAN